MAISGVRLRVQPGAYKAHLSAAERDPPPTKWSDLRYVSDIEEDCNGKEALQA